ncbi:NADH:flavin oxidoreductase/NADH oxidase family protein [uncultured Nocardioides sp.]|uniref:NADH:flavin oxidoreductase/NADH oxidase family protein n=1 Tax=uncultured Nocardioides sp. TaxID=198441 RepID=UPI002618C0B0|nr:NADH:flavin oxidoreductase/NADH oxidase family protein [uncultured Nocardioides sp.]
MPRLSDPLTLPSGLTLPHRIAKAPMTENLADAGHQATPALEAVYRRWAAGAAGGLLVTGNLMVDRRYLERSRNVVADERLDVARLARVRRASGSSPLIAQLSHPGRQTNRFITGRPLAPSAEAGAVRMAGLFAKPRALADGEIEAIVAGFGASARRCEEAGFEGVQVHAAHGYLLAQFLSPYVNRRTDRWGGDLEGRSRALVQAVRAVRASTGEGFTVAVKLNSSDFRHGGFTEDDAEQVVRMLVEEGVDLVEISGGTYENPALFGEVDELSEERGATGHKEAYFAGFARRVRATAGTVPVMLTGGIRTRATMEQLLEDGGVDLIGLGRPLAVDPDLTGRLLAGEDGHPLPRYTLPTVAGLAGESEWYETQIARMGRGKDPDPGLHAATAATRFIVGEAVRGLSGRRGRRG